MATVGQDNCGQGRRALGAEVLVCPKCSGICRVLAAIHDPVVLARELGAMGLSARVPELAGSRAWNRERHVAKPCKNDQLLVQAKSRPRATLRVE